MLRRRHPAVPPLIPSPQLRPAAQTVSRVATESLVSGSPSRLILIVDDDARLATLLRQFLLARGFRAEVESRGDRAVERIWGEKPDLVLLDLTLPGGSGFEVCRRARERFSRGIVILTASRAEVDQVVGLELGADDYVVKPVEPRVLLARIQSILRRLTTRETASALPCALSVGSLAVDRSRRHVTVDGRVVATTDMEFEVLWVLTRLAGEVVSREELSLHVRGVPYDGLDRGLDVHVSRLRRKLEDAGIEPNSLKSVRGLGYLLEKR